jgi:hypothetical protein
MQKHLTRHRKSIHLTLEVKIFFNNSTPAIVPAQNSAFRKSGLAMRPSSASPEEREGETCTQTVIKQSLSDYA